MAFYLVSAVPKHGLMEELSARLAQDEFITLKPFGGTLTHSLRNARIRWDGVAVWEEEDYCSPACPGARGCARRLFRRSSRRDGERRRGLGPDRGLAASVSAIRDLTNAVGVG